MMDGIIPIRYSGSRQATPIGTGRSTRVDRMPGLDVWVHSMIDLIFLTA